MPTGKQQTGKQQKGELGWEAEYDLIRDLLSSKLALLRFPDALEGDLRSHLYQRAVTTLRENFWMMSLLYILAACLTAAFFGQRDASASFSQDARTAFAIFIVSGLCVTAITVLLRFPTIKDRYMAYVGPPAVLALVALNIGPMLFRDSFLQQQTSYYVIYVLLIIYGASNMRLVQAAQVGFSSLFLSLVVLILNGHTSDMILLLQRGLMSNVVGCGLAYVLETRDRRLFLQSRLLDLEKRQLNRLTERMVQLAREDGLTGLANRRHFNDNFLLEWERGRRDRYPLSLIFVDIDYFKAFNDNHGHLEGDRALAAVAAELKPLARRVGDLAARYGGEEFVLLLPNTPLAGARDIAKEMLAAVDRRQIPHKASGVANHVTVSIGVATMVPDVHVAPSQLIDLADAALYTAKEAGRHQVVASDFD